MTWLRYDEQFRQRKGVWPVIRWEHKDIGLWMKLMTPPGLGISFFQEGLTAPVPQVCRALGRKGSVGSLLRVTADSAVLVVLNPNVPDAVAAIHSPAVLNQEKVRQVIRLERGRTPVRVERMVPFLNRYPD